MYNGKIIDMHAHIFPEKIADKAVASIGKFYDLGMTKDGRARTLIENGSKIGVEKYLVFSTATTASQVDSINSYIAGEVNNHPEFVGFGTIHRDVENPEEVIENVISLGLKGIKLHPDFQRFNIDDEKMYRIYEIIDGRLPIYFHTSDSRYPYSEPERLARVAKDFPKQRVIGAHFGGYSLWDRIGCYDGLDNVYFDTSSSLFLLDKETAVGFINRFGKEKFFFGTDYPMWDHVEELNRFLSLGLDDETNEMILYKNAELFLGL